MRRRPPSWLPPPAPFTQSWCALIHISPETRIITRPRSLIGHGRHLISFLLANLQNSFNSKCNGDWLRLIKVKLFKMLNLHSLLSHLTWLPLRPFISANKIRHLSTVNQSDSREQLRRCTCEHVTRCDAPLSRDTPPMCHTSHVTWRYCDSWHRVTLLQHSSCRHCMEPGLRWMQENRQWGKKQKSPF